MNRPSLYAAFGDKHSLYIKALEQYWEVASADMQAALTDPGLTLREALMRFYEGQLSIYFSGEGQPRGCFAIGKSHGAAGLSGVKFLGRVHLRLFLQSLTDNSARVVLTRIEFPPIQLAEVFAHLV